MCVKLFSGDLNSGSYPLHPTGTNTCIMTIASKVCSENSFLIHETINLKEIEFYKDIV